MSSKQKSITPVLIIILLVVVSSIAYLMFSRNSVSLTQPSNPVTDNSRPQLKTEDLNKKYAPVPYKWSDLNFDPANETVEYNDPITRLIVEIPYNKNWGTKDFSLAPYEGQQLYPEKFYLQFGHVVYGCDGPCDTKDGIQFWSRTYIMSADPKKTKEEYLAYLKVNNSGETITTENINGKDVVILTGGTHDGPADLVTYVVIGKNKNYTIQQAVNSYTPENWEDKESDGLIRKVIASMRFN